MKQMIVSLFGFMFTTGLLVGGCAASADEPMDHASTATHAAEETVLSQRVSTAAISARVFEAFSDTNEIGTRGHDFVYPDMALNLPPGTWLIEAEATVFTNDVPDAANLGLYNATNGTDVLASRSGVGITPSAGWTVPLHASKVVTLSVPAVIQIKAFRNGSSTPGFGYPLALAGGRQRLFAVELL
jgi:hypothetical protein